MSRKPTETAIIRQGDASRGPLDLTGRHYQALWFSLAGLAWNSLVLVPADHRGSTAHIARALADIGDQLSVVPVTSVVANHSNYRSAVQIAVGVSGTAWADEERAVPRAGRALISIDSVIDEPLGVAVCQAADATVICVELGRSGLAAVRRSIELIGRDRIVGTFVID